LAERVKKLYTKEDMMAMNLNQAEAYLTNFHLNGMPQTKVGLMKLIRTQLGYTKIKGNVNGKNSGLIPLHQAEHKQLRAVFRTNLEQAKNLWNHYVDEMRNDEALFDYHSRLQETANDRESSTDELESIIGLN